MDSTLKAQVHDRVQFRNRNGTTPKVDVGVVKAIRIQIGLLEGTNAITRTVEYLIERPPRDKSSRKLRRNWVLEDFIIRNLSRTDDLSQT